MIFKDDNDYRNPPIPRSEDDLVERVRKFEREYRNELNAAKEAALVAQARIDFALSQIKARRQASMPSSVHEHIFFLEEILMGMFDEHIKVVKP